MRCANLSAVAVGLALVLGACTSTSYTRATAPYARAMAEGTAAFVAELELAEHVCQRRAELDVLRHLLEGSENQTVDWATHCQSIGTATALQRRAASVLVGYAQALADLAAGASYSGNGLQGVATGASSLLERLASASGPEAAYAKALGTPLTQLVNFLLTQAASVSLKKSIEASAPAVEAMLAAMVTYLEATDQQLLVYEHEVERFLIDAEARLRLEGMAGSKPGPGGKVSPVSAFLFVREAGALRLEIATGHRRHAALRSALDSLAEAERRLVRAGERDEQELDRVAADAVAAAEAVRDFLRAVPTME